MHNREKGFSHIVLFVLMLIVLGTVGLAGWRVYELSGNKAGTPNTTIYNNNPCQPKAADRPAAADITISVCKALSTLYTIHDSGVVSVVQQDDLTVSYQTTQVDTMSWRFAGDNYALYHMLTNDDSKLTINFNFGEQDGHPNKTQRIKLQTTAVQELERHGLQKQTTPHILVSSSSLLSYIGSNTICQVSDIVDHYSSPISSDLFEVTCVPLAVFTTLSSQIKPIAAALPPIVKGDLYVFQSPVIIDSKTPGYRILWSGIMEPESISYYLYEMGTTWHLAFTGSSSEKFSCDTSQYPNAVDVRLAFLGQSCDNNGEPGTVR